MKKERANSTWNKMTAEQRRKLDGWLFEEGLSYKEILARAPTELGMTPSAGALSRYYGRALKYRVVDELGDSEETVQELNETPVKLENLRNSTLKVAAQRLLVKVMKDGDVKDIGVLGRLLSDGEKRQIQRDRLMLARERFQFNAAEAALKELPHVENMTEEDLRRERARINGIIRRLFGTNTPEIDP